MVIKKSDVDKKDDGACPVCGGTPWTPETNHRASTHSGSCGVYAMNDDELAEFLKKK